MTPRQLSKIKKLEDDFDLVKEVIKTLDGALYDYAAVQRRITRLTEYQGSGQWLKDFEPERDGSKASRGTKDPWHRCPLPEGGSPEDDGFPETAGLFLAESPIFSKIPLKITI